MSDGKWKKLHQRKKYKERGQASNRAHLGLLEKRKDYLLRAKNFHKKQDAIQKLQIKAAFRNPDEFYHKMVNTKRVDGKHRNQDDSPLTREEELQVKTNDIDYLTMRKVMEDRKVEKMQSSLHMARNLSEQELKNKHMVFVDTPEEAAEFDEEEYFETPKEYLTRAYNRPTKKALEEGNMLVTQDISARQLAKQERKRSLAYGELAARIDRAAKLDDLVDRLELKRELMKNSNVVKIKRAGKVVYKWKPQRKR